MAEAVQLLTRRGLRDVRLGGARISRELTPARALQQAKAKQGVLVVRGAAGVTAGSLVQLMLSQELRSLVRDNVDVVFLVRDPKADWYRSIFPQAVFPRVKVGDVEVVGFKDGNLLLNVDGVSVRLVNEEALKSDRSIGERPTVFIDYPSNKMEELVPWLDLGPNLTVLKPQVIAGQAVRRDGQIFDPKSGPLMQARVREDGIFVPGGRMQTTLSCTTTGTVGCVATIDSILQIQHINWGRLSGIHTHTGEKTIPDHLYTTTGATGAAKATGRVFPGISGWENFGGEVWRAAVEEPSALNILLDANVGTMLPQDAFDLALLQAARRHPYLMGLVDPKLVSKEKRLNARHFREAANRAIVRLGAIEVSPIAPNRARIFVRDSKYNNVVSFNVWTYEDALALLQQLGVQVERDVFERLPKCMAVMGPDALDVAIEKQQRVISGAPAQVVVPEELEPLQTDDGLAPVYDIKHFRAGAAPAAKTVPLPPVRIEELGERNRALLDAYGLRLTEGSHTFLVDKPRNPNAARTGFVQDELSEDLGLSSVLTAAAVGYHGRGGLVGLAPGRAKTLKPLVKMNLDRAASATLAASLDDIASRFPDVVFCVTVTEGARPKIEFGESGGNPTLFEGELFGRPELTQRRLEDLRKDSKVRVFDIIVDVVDKTTAAATGEHNAVVAFLVVDGKAQEIVDARVTKLMGAGGLPGITDLRKASPQQVARAIAEGCGVEAKDLWLFNLLKTREERLGPLTDPLRALVGGWMTDDGGDVMPPLAAALGVNPVMGGSPLHGMAANQGGSAELPLLLPAEWLGAKVLASFMNITDPNLLNKIAASGYNPRATFGLEKIFGEGYLSRDGAGIFAGITDNYSIPELGGVQIHDDGIVGSTLAILSQGLAGIPTYNLEFTQGKAFTRLAMTPLIGRLRGLGSQEAMEEAIVKWMAAPSEAMDNPHSLPRRLQRDIGQDFFCVADQVYTAGKFVGWEVNQGNLKAFSEGKNPRFDAKDAAILAALKTKTPWVVGEGTGRGEEVVVNDAWTDSVEAALQDYEEDRG